MERKVTKEVASRFLALSELYFKMTEQTERVISNNEIELLVASVDKSNLSMLSTKQIN